MGGIALWEHLHGAGGAYWRQESGSGRPLHALMPYGRPAAGGGLPGYKASGARSADQASAKAYALAGYRWRGFSTGTGSGGGGRYSVTPDPDKTVMAASLAGVAVRYDSG